MKKWIATSLLLVIAACLQVAAHAQIIANVKNDQWEVGCIKWVFQNDIASATALTNDYDDTVLDYEWTTNDPVDIDAWNGVSGFVSPSEPRTLAAFVKDASSGSATCTVTIMGVNQFGSNVGDTFTLTAGTTPFGVTKNAYTLIEDIDLNFDSGATSDTLKIGVHGFGLPVRPPSVKYVLLWKTGTVFADTNAVWATSGYSRAYGTYEPTNAEVLALDAGTSDIDQSGYIEFTWATPTTAITPVPSGMATPTATAN